MKATRTARVVGLAALALVGSKWAAAPVRAQEVFDFGPVAVGYSRQIPIVYINTGPIPFSLGVVGATDPFGTPDKGKSFFLKPGDQVTIPVTYAPRSVTADSGILALNTTNPAQPTLSATLKGRGIDGDQITDLTGTWTTATGGAFSLVRDDSSSALYDPLDVEGTSASPVFSSVYGRFDGSQWSGTWDSKDRTLNGPFQFALKRPDRLEGFFYYANGKSTSDQTVVLTRHSTFDGQWQTAYGVMTIYRIFSDDARKLLNTGEFSTLDAPPRATWYSGEYPWSGGGDILAYSTAAGGLVLRGRYSDADGTGSFYVATSDANAGSFAGTFTPDDGSGTISWSGTYLGPSGH